MIISPLNLLHEVLLALPDDLEILAISVLDPLYPLQSEVKKRYEYPKFYLQLGVNHQGPLD